MKKVNGWPLNSPSLAATLASVGATGFIRPIYPGDRWHMKELQDFFGVYLICMDGIAYYVGQTINFKVRPRQHFTGCGVPSNIPLTEWELANAGKTYMVPIHLEKIDGSDEQADRMLVMEGLIADANFDNLFNKVSPKRPCNDGLRKRMSEGRRRCLREDPTIPGRQSQTMRDGYREGRIVPWNKGKTGIYSQKTLDAMVEGRRRNGGYTSWNKGTGKGPGYCDRCPKKLSQEELDSQKDTEFKTCFKCRLIRNKKHMDARRARQKEGVCKYCGAGVTKGTDMCDRHIKLHEGYYKDARRRAAEVRKEREAAGLCTSCGQRPAVKGFKLCQNCKDTAKKNNEFYEAHEKVKVRNGKLMSEGRCIRCKKKHNNPRSPKHCEDCRKYLNVQKKDYKYDQEKANACVRDIRAHRKANRLCRDCGVKLQPNETLYCPTHKAIDRERKKAWYLRNKAKAKS